VEQEGGESERHSTNHKTQDLFLFVAVELGL
jgi:hypothetical protein